VVAFVVRAERLRGPGTARLKRVLAQFW